MLTTDIQAELGIGIAEFMSQEIPNFNMLTYRQILEARRTPYWHSLKEWFHRIAREENQKVGLAQRAHEEMYTSSLKLAHEIEPRLGIAILKGIMSNAPVPYVNPVGLVLSGKEVVKTKKLAQKYGHVFFWASIEKRAGEEFGTMQRSGWPLLSREMLRE